MAILRASKKKGKENVMPLKVGDAVFCTLDAKLKKYEVIHVVKQGRPPRYQLQEVGGDHTLILPMKDEDDWLMNYIFPRIEVRSAIEDVERRVQAALDEWANDLFHDRQRLAEHLFQLWAGIDNWASRSSTGEQSPQLRERKIQVMAAKMEEFFGVTVDVSKAEKM